MIYSYCKRCRMESPGDVCAGCGRRASAAFLQDKWSVESIPLRDSRIWRGAFFALLGAAGLLLAVVFGLQAVFNISGVAMLWRSALIRVTLAFTVIGLAVVFLFLLLQGRESNVFTLDASGARQYTLHGPQKWKSWARLQSADPAKVRRAGTAQLSLPRSHLIVAELRDGIENIFRFHSSTPSCSSRARRLRRRRDKRRVIAF